MEYAIVFLPLIGSLIGYLGRSLTKYFAEISTSLFVSVSAALSIYVFWNGLQNEIYGNYKIDDNLSLFGRYDKITSEDAEENKWDRSNDGKLTIVGVERKMTKGVTLSLNMQTSKDGQRNSEESSIFYLNIECKL